MRDYIEVHQHNGTFIRRVPVVRLDDETYEDEDHVVLIDNNERRLVARGIEEMREQRFRAGWASGVEKRWIMIGGFVIAISSVVGMGLSAYAVFVLGK